MRTQRGAYTNGRLGSSRISRLEALDGWSWDPHADQWEEGFSVLLDYTTRVGTSRVKRGYVEGEYKLGNWVVNQRARKGKSSRIGDPSKRSTAGAGTDTPTNGKKAFRCYSTTQLV